MGIICSTLPTLPALCKGWRGARGTSARKSSRSRRFTVRASELRSPVRALTVNRPATAGVARAQCALCADRYRQIEEGRITQASRREANNIRQNIREAVPVDSFFFESV